MKELVDDYNKKKLENFYIEKEQELFTQEINKLRETYKDVNWNLNKDWCTKILAFDKPPAVISNLLETFMHTLDQKDTSWNNFKVLYLVK
jgi:hypothetical protein